MSSARLGTTLGRRRRGAGAFVLDRPEHIAALQSAVRQEIVDTLQAAGPRSVLELAQLMGRPPDALYYHVRKLVGVGLLIVRGSRRRGRRTEAIYDLVGHPLKLVFPRSGDPRADPLMRLVGSMLRTAGRDFRRGLLNGAAVSEGPERNLWAGRHHAWLTPAELRRVDRSIGALLAMMRKSREPRRGQLCTLTLVMAPRAPQHRGARRRR